MAHIDDLTRTEEGALLIMRAAKLLRRINVDAQTMLIALEFKRGASIEDLAGYYNLTEVQIQTAIRDVMRRIQ